MSSRRTFAPLTTWHSQTGLLLISFTWGASYAIPAPDRVQFSEVFPIPTAGVLPMWVWGTVMLVAAAVAYAAEWRLRRNPSSRPSWASAWGGHMVLSAVYFTLAAASFVEGFSEISTAPHVLHGLFAVISAISRPVLWGYIGYLHTTYARLPRPRVEGSL